MADVDFDFVVPTGEYIIEWLDENNVTRAGLARQLGCSRKHVTELLQGASLTPDFALRLSRVTGIPADRWMQIESFYRSEVARLELEQEPAVVREVLNGLPLKTLRDLGHISTTLRHPGKCAMEVLAFYRAGNLDVLKSFMTQPAAVAFRQSAKLDWAARLTWLRLVEHEAARRDSAEPFNREALEHVVQHMRSLTVRDPGEYGQLAVDMLAQVGVRLVFVHSVPKAGTYGAARWFEGSPLVALSLLRKSEDQFWFTLFHELFHVMRHDLTPEGYVSGEWGDGRLEDEANRFAGELLIPANRSNELTNLRTVADVRTFAADIGISPGIVIGRLHHEKLWLYSAGQQEVQRLILIDEDGDS